MKNLNDSFDLCKMILDDCNIPYDHNTTIKVNRRLTACYGRNVWSRRNGQCTNSIEINDVLLSDSVGDKALENTILHELLHTNSDCHNHGTTWRRYAGIVNRKYGYDIRCCGGDKGDRDDSGAAAALLEKRKKSSPYKYMLYCPTCGAKWYYRRKTKAITNPGGYRCGRCKTTLVSKTLTECEQSVANR